MLFKNSIAASMFLFTLVLSTASPGMADSGVSQSIYSLIQEGQDVEVTVSTGEREPPPYSIYVERMNEKDKVKVVRKNMTVEEDDAIFEGDPYCNHSSVSPAEGQDCEVDPTGCVDCDGDGVLECIGDHCIIPYRFVFKDSCVSPGSWTYTTDKVGHLGQETIEVEDTGASCLSGCSVVSVSGIASSPGGILFFVMMVIGLTVFLFFGRRGRSDG